MHFVTLSRSLRSTKVTINLLRRYHSRNILKLSERGIFQDIFPDKSANEIVDLCNGKPQTVYAGFDPTAKSLHLGNLLVLINLLHWQRAGHNVIALIGSATARIGDPSGRNTDRPEEEIDEFHSNSQSIIRQITQIFNNHEIFFWDHDDRLEAPKIVDNWEWYNKLNVVDFIGSVGRKVRVGNMMSRSCVSSRLHSESGLSFSEFSYQIFQAYDWLHLLRKHNCRFQVGGNDQMGNIVSGHDLIGRVGSKSVFGLTVPLIVNDLGDKYGKSARNAVWLDPELTTHFDFYQYLIRTPDNEVGKLLRLFSFRPLNEIEQVLNHHRREPEKRLAQNVLANDVMLLVRGKEGLEVAQCATGALYSSDIEALTKLDHQTVKSIFRGATQVEIILQPGLTISQLSLAAKCFLNQTAAERIIKSGGFYINHKKCTNPDEVIMDGIHILPNKTTLLRVGKKNYSIVKWLS